MDEQRVAAISAEIAAAIAQAQSRLYEDDVDDEEGEETGAEEEQETEVLGPMVSGIRDEQGPGLQLDVNRMAEHGRFGDDFSVAMHGHGQDDMNEMASGSKRKR